MVVELIQVVEICLLIIHKSAIDLFCSNEAVHDCQHFLPLEVLISWTMSSKIMSFVSVKVRPRPVPLILLRDKPKISFVSVGIVCVLYLLL
jgi:hypothetical protein